MGRKGGLDCASFLLELQTHNFIGGAPLDIRWSPTPNRALHANIFTDGPAHNADDWRAIEMVAATHAFGSEAHTTTRQHSLMVTDGRLTKAKTPHLRLHAATHKAISEWVG